MPIGEVIIHCRTYFHISEYESPINFDFTYLPPIREAEERKIARAMRIEEALEKIGELGASILRAILPLEGITLVTIDSNNIVLTVGAETYKNILYPVFREAVEEAEKRWKEIKREN